MAEIVLSGRGSTQLRDVTDGYTMQNMKMKANDIDWDVGERGRIITFDPPLGCNIENYATVTIQVDGSPRKYDALFENTPRSATGRGSDPKIYILIPSSDKEILTNVKSDGVNLVGIESRSEPNALSGLKVGG